MPSPNHPPLYSPPADEERALDWDLGQAAGLKHRPGWGWRQAFFWNREELLDSYSDPPAECELYGETLVIDGVEVGVWGGVVDYETDVVTLMHGTYELGPPPPDGKEWAREWRLERERERAGEELIRQRNLEERIKLERKAVQAALRELEKRSRREAAAAAKRRRVGLGEIDNAGHRLKWPFGPPVVQKKGWKPTTGRWIAPQPDWYVEPPEPDPPPPPPPPPPRFERRPKPLVKVRDRDGGLWLLEEDVYKDFWDEAVRKGVNQEEWILYRIRTITARA